MHALVLPLALLALLCLPCLVAMLICADDLLDRAAYRLRRAAGVPHAATPDRPP